jgi:hypothetical protein
VGLRNSDPLFPFSSSSTSKLPTQTSIALFHLDERTRDALAKALFLRAATGLEKGLKQHCVKYYIQYLGMWQTARLSEEKVDHAKWRKVRRFVSSSLPTHKPQSSKHVKQEVCVNRMGTRRSK